MTNADIILSERLTLQKQGKIKTLPGKKITIVDNNGNDKVIDCPEMIYTIPAINAMHRQVKKGEKAITSFKIWIPKEDKDEEHDNNEVIKKKEFIMKTAFFFRYDQTEERK